MESLFSPTIKIINNSTNSNPEYETIGSAGMDLRSNQDVIIESGKSEIIKTGLHIQLPIGFEAQIRSRSGLTAKKQVIVLNAPGTIDSDYTGEIGIILGNLSTEAFKVNKGDRIAQMIIAEYRQLEFENVQSLDDTERGDGGFGSTGIV